MPTYDYKCRECDKEFERITSISNRNSQVCECGSEVDRVYKANSVIPDEIPGGVLIENGLCNADGSPRRYYSKSEIEREAKKRGYTNYVQGEHTGKYEGEKKVSRWV